jgi:nickel-dependent lactate racemase
LPNGANYQVFHSISAPPLENATAAIEGALQKPTAGPPLADLAKGKHSAAISVCDITRPAPNSTVLPPVLRALEAAGVREIRIMIATGLHRAATQAEIRQIVGEEIAGRYAVLNHDARNQDDHRYLGNTKSGTPIWIDRRFLDSELHMSLGFIEPHLMLGFSGGRKLVAPGLAGQETIKEIHSSRFMRDGRATEGSIDDNPLHAELLEIARTARHDFLVDVAMTRDRRIAQVFAGEPQTAHKAGIDWVRHATLQRTPAFDAVITTGGGYPLDLTYYQVIKGVTAAAHLVKPGGKILLVAPCEEGVGAPEFREMVAAYNSADSFMQAIDGAPVTIDQWQLEKLALAQPKAQVLFCVPGVPQDYRGSLWGPFFEDAAEAIRVLLASLPPGSRVAVVPEGPYVLAQANA